MRHAPLFKYKVRGAFDFLRHIFHGRITLSPASVYGAQNEAYMSRSAEKWVRDLCFNELGVCG